MKAKDMPQPVLPLALLLTTPVLLAQTDVTVKVPASATPDPTCSGRCYTPVEAVTLASQLAPRGALAGRFAVQVKAVGEANGRFFLNSETDYRDRNCLTLALTADVAKAQAGRAELAAVRDRFLGKWVYVDGVAARRRIMFVNDDGKATDKYYFQIHVVVGNPRQILSDPNDRPE
ncbi:hypothetical protein ACFOON_09895 [Novosphingobium piscinae]|uniref:hypothetical protein n=1 Tax=Novosphingobium piscinae TaxID=1507448 RepID=UPI00361405F3